MPRLRRDDFSNEFSRLHYYLGINCFKLGLRSLKLLGISSIVNVRFVTKITCLSAFIISCVRLLYSIRTTLYCQHIFLTFFIFFLTLFLLVFQVLYIAPFLQFRYYFQIKNILHFLREEYFWRNKFFIYSF